MKKFLAITLVAAALLTIGCTKTKKEVDWVTTILLYILNKPSSPGDKCNVLLSDDTTLAFCKQYRSGYTDAEQSAECGDVLVAKLSALGVSSLKTKKATVSACSQEGLLGSCTVTEGTEKNKSGELYFYKAGNWNTAAATVVCTNAGSTFTEK